MWVRQTTDGRAGENDDESSLNGGSHWFAIVSWSQWHGGGPIRPRSIQFNFKKKKKEEEEEGKHPPGNFIIKLASRGPTWGGGEKEIRRQWKTGKQCFHVVFLYTRTHTRTWQADPVPREERESGLLFSFTFHYPPARAPPSFARSLVQNGYKTQRHTFLKKKKKKKKKKKMSVFVGYNKHARPCISAAKRRDKRPDPTRITQWVSASLTHTHTPCFCLFLLLLFSSNGENGTRDSSSRPGGDGDKPRAREYQNKGGGVHVRHFAHQRRDTHTPTWSPPASSHQDDQDEDIKCIVDDLLLRANSRRRRRRRTRIKNWKEDLRCCCAETGNMAIKMERKRKEKGTSWSFKRSAPSSYS